MRSVHKDKDRQYIDGELASKQQKKEGLLTIGQRKKLTSWLLIPISKLWRQDSSDRKNCQIDFQTWPIFLTSSLIWLVLQQ